MHIVEMIRNSLLNIERNKCAKLFCNTMRELLLTILTLVNYLLFKGVEAFLTLDIILLSKADSEIIGKLWEPCLILYLMYSFTCILQAFSFALSEICYT